MMYVKMLSRRLLSASTSPGHVFRYSLFKIPLNHLSTISKRDLSSYTSPISRRYLTSCPTSSTDTADDLLSLHPRKSIVPFYESLPLSKVGEIDVMVKNMEEEERRLLSLRVKKCSSANDIESRIDRIQEIIGYSFRDREICKCALMHPSYPSGNKETYAFLLRHGLVAIKLATHQLISIIGDKEEASRTFLKGHEQKVFADIMNAVDNRHFMMNVAVNTGIVNLVVRQLEEELESRVQRYVSEITVGNQVQDVTKGDFSYTSKVITDSLKGVLGAVSLDSNSYDQMLEILKGVLNLESNPVIQVYHKYSNARLTAPKMIHDGPKWFFKTFDSHLFPEATSRIEAALLALKEIGENPKLPS